MQIKAVIFDFNGVIVDDEPLHLELMQTILHAEGIPLSQAECRAHCLGVTDRAGFGNVLRAFERAGDDAYVSALIARKAAAYAKASATRDLLFPHVADLIGALAQRVPLALVSGALRQEIDSTLERANLRACFCQTISGEDVQHGKPDPEGFLQALTTLQALNPQAALAPHECLVIEDSRAGIAAAKRAGMRCLAVATSYQANELTAADWIIDRLEREQIRQQVPPLFALIEP